MFCTSVCWMGYCSCLRSQQHSCRTVRDSFFLSAFLQVSPPRSLQWHNHEHHTDSGKCCLHVPWHSFLKRTQFHLTLSFMCNDISSTIQALTYMNLAIAGNSIMGLHSHQVTCTSRVRRIHSYKHTGSSQWSQLKQSYLSKGPIENTVSALARTKIIVRTVASLWGINIQHRARKGFPFMVNSSLREVAYG